MITAQYATNRFGIAIAVPKRKVRGISERFFRRKILLVWGMNAVGILFLILAMRAMD